MGSLEVQHRVHLWAPRVYYLLVLGRISYWDRIISMPGECHLCQIGTWGWPVVVHGQSCQIQHSDPVLPGLWLPGILSPSKYHQLMWHTWHSGKIQGIAWFRYIGHSDLYNIYYGMSHVWYTPGGSGCRVCYPTSKKSKCTLTGSCWPILSTGGLIRSCWPT